MTSSKKQKRNVLIIGIIAIIAFFGYVIWQTVSTETEWKYEKYNDGYRLYSYTQGFSDKTTEIIIPDTYEGKAVVAIDDKVFYKNKKIKKVIIPDSVTELGASVFKGCENLETIEFGKNITVIGGECFKDCKSLVEAILPEGITELRGEAFMGCSSLENVVLPINITEIRGNMFENCSSLKSVHIPSGVTRIAAHAFYGCSSLSDVFVPDTVVEIGSSAFRLCSSLEEIELPENASINERAFKESPTNILKKQIPDDLWDEINNEILGRESYEALYVIYDKSLGEDKILINSGFVCIVDSIKYEEIIKDGYGLKKFTETDKLVAYLEEAKTQGAKYIQHGFYTEIGSKKTGIPYFVKASAYIDDYIKDITDDEADSSGANVNTYSNAESAKIEIEADSNSPFDMSDVIMYDLPDDATAEDSELNGAADSIGE